jgi:hypothetical protein
LLRLSDVSRRSFLGVGVTIPASHVGSTAGSTAGLTISTIDRHNRTARGETAFSTLVESRTTVYEEVT